ncbi:MAG: threonine/serine dehydratase [Caldilineaceae bacterium]|nr:threonine/serine dehydratase [Caldilineaceae bacterium]
MEIPTVAEMRNAHAALAGFVVETPVWRWANQDVKQHLGPETEVYLKLELFQHTGTFKPRGALTVMRKLDQATLAKGVTAVSAGNHAIAVAFAAQLLGTTAKVVMPKSASPIRVATCRAYGAEVELVDNVTIAFQRVQAIQAEEARYFVHPFEGPDTILGTATIGVEFCEQVAALDAVIIPIGGGGLCAGIATAVKQIQPSCLVFGVEPVGADTMHRSFAAGSPQSISAVQTIADSLGAPHAAPYSFGLCQRFVDELVLLTDDEIRQAMALLFRSMKLAVEPAGATATAALWGPLRERLRGKRVGVIVCGANLDIATFAAHVSQAEANAGKG